MYTHTHVSQTFLIRPPIQITPRFEVSQSFSNYNNGYLWLYVYTYVQTRKGTHTHTHICIIYIPNFSQKTINTDNTTLIILKLQLWVSWLNVCTYVYTHTHTYIFIIYIPNFSHKTVNNTMDETFKHVQKKKSITNHLGQL